MIYIGGSIFFGLTAARYEQGRFFNPREVFNKRIDWKWPMMLMSITDDEFLEQCGVDGLVFLRFNRLCFKLFAAYTAFGIIVLGPIYYSCGNEPNLSAIQSWSMNNILPNHLTLGNNVLWASTATGWIYSMYGLYLFHQECKNYIKLRHKYLQSRLPHQFSVYVEEIPSQMQSTEILKAFFQMLYPEDFHSTALVIVAPELAQAKEQLKALKKEIRIVTIVEKATGTPQYKRDWFTWITCSLCASNELVLPGLHMQGRALQKKIKKLSQELEGKMRLESSLSREQLSSKLSGNDIARDDAPEKNSKGLAEPLLSSSNLYDDEDIEARGEEFNFSGAIDEKGHPSLLLSKGSARMVDKGSKLMADPRQWSNLFKSKEQLFALGDVTTILKGTHFSSTGFVTFKTMKAAVMAQNLRHIHNGMRVKPAPPVDAVIWTNVGLPDQSRFIRGWIVFALSVGLTFAWGTITVAVSTLTVAANIQHWTGVDLSGCEWCKTLLKMTAPLLVAYLFSLLPPLFEWFALLGGASAKEELNASVYKKFFQFIVIQSLFFYIVGGAMMDSISEFLSNPKGVPAVMGKAVPDRANFFMQFILLRSLPLNILQLFRKSAWLELYTLRAWNRTVASTRRLTRAATATSKMARKMTARAAGAAANAGTGTASAAFSGARKMTAGAADGARKMTAGAADGARKMTAGAADGARKMTAGAADGVKDGATGAWGMTRKLTGTMNNRSKTINDGSDDVADGGSDDPTDSPSLHAEYEEMDMQAPTSKGEQESTAEVNGENKGKRQSHVDAYKAALKAPADVVDQGRPGRRSMTLDMGAVDSEDLPIAEAEVHAVEGTAQAPQTEAVEDAAPALATYAAQLKATVEEAAAEALGAAEAEVAKAAAQSQHVALEAASTGESNGGGESNVASTLKPKVGFALETKPSTKTVAVPPPGEELSFTFTEEGSLGIDVDELNFEDVVGVSGAAAAVGMRAGDMIIGINGERLVLDRRSVLTNQLATQLSLPDRPCTVQVRRPPPTSSSSAPAGSASPIPTATPKRKKTRVGFAQEVKPGAAQQKRKSTRVGFGAEVKPGARPKRKNTRVGFAQEGGDEGHTRETKEKVRRARLEDEECSLEITRGALGINISDTGDKGYSAQFNHFTGESDAEQLVGGQLKCGLVVVKINDENQIGVAYDDILRTLESVRPVNILFRSNPEQRTAARKPSSKGDDDMEMYATSGPKLKKQWGGFFGGIEKDEGTEMQEMGRESEAMSEQSMDWRVTIDEDDDDLANGFDEEAEAEAKIFSPSKNDNADNPLPIQVGCSMYCRLLDVL
jgi:hypothetical protein